VAWAPARALLNFKESLILHYLVTGGAGFIGSHLVETLLAENSRVTVVDNFDPFYPRAQKLENLANSYRHPNFRLIEVDICDPYALQTVADRYDCIVHLAGKGGVRPSIANPVAYQQVNVGGTQNLLELARECAVPQFIFASSSSVYGANPNTPWIENDHVLLPISPYASTKVSGELLGHVYSHLYDIRFISLRFFTVYGPRQRPDLAIRKFAEMILAGRPIPFYGDGSTSRDYTYVDDIVAGIRAAIDYRASAYEVINLGNNRAITLSEMVHTIEDALDRKALLDLRTQQPGDLPHTCASLAKARDLLGYAPRTSFPDGVARFVAWLTSENFTRYNFTPLCEVGDPGRHLSNGPSF
jgi:UDP-glucuronate 4-epimerase